MCDDETHGDMDSLKTYLTECLDERIVDTAVLEVGLNRVIQVATTDDPQAYVVRQPNKTRDDVGFVDVATMQ